ncbi:MAG: helix-turn-helix transcriptional regulator [Geminicoccaceae bacterium]
MVEPDLLSLPDLLDLVELCYASVADPQLWSEFLGACERAFAATVSAVVTFEPPPVGFTWWVLRGLTREQEVGLEHWGYHDPRNELFARLLRPGEAYSFDGSHDIEGFKRSPYYVEYQSKIGVLWAIIARLGEGRGLEGLWAIHRPERAPAFAAAETQAAAVLARHIGRARRLQLDLDTARADQALHRDLIDRLPHGLLLLSAEGRIIEANRAARAMLDERDGLEAPGLVLRASEREASRTLAGMIHAAARGLLDGVGGVLAIPRPSGRQPYLASVARCFIDLARLLGQRAAVIVTLTDPARPIAASATALRRAWGLTAAEAQLVLGLAQGMTLQQVAAQAGIGHETARAHLKHAFAKTGTHHQVELVRLILSSEEALLAPAQVPSP